LYLREEHLLTRIGAQLAGNDHEDQLKLDEVVTFLHVSVLAVTCDADEITISGGPPNTRIQTAEMRPGSVG
jgi:hypothetical protein